MHSLVHSPFLVILSLGVACGGSSATSRPATQPLPDVHPLAGLAADGAIVAPTHTLRIAPALNWSTTADAGRGLLRGLDDDIAAALAERGLTHGWILPADLATSYKRNPSYATDPYALAEEPLRARSFVAGSRLTEPLASQLRTMIALHENARAVLLPIELRFERVDSSTTVARATLRAALVDPRFSEALWVGDVRTDAASSDLRVFTKALALRFADLIASR
jgi:hypothetical protein